MLVLTRKENQKIKIGSCIEITIVKLDGGRVRIGIEAPPDILILRGELEAFAQTNESTVPETIPKSTRRRKRHVA